MNESKISKAWILIKADLLKVWKGFLLAIGGAFVAFLGDLASVIDYSQYGDYGAVIALLVASVASSLINLIRKWMTTNKY